MSESLADVGATEAAGARLAALLRPGDAVALFGDLGMGKTSFSRGVLRALGFVGEVASPTFPIVQPYGPPETAFPVWHIDLYRIESASELAELALDEARLDSALLIEWPERLPHLWPDTLRLHLSAAPGGGRVLTAQVPAAWADRWP